jgi:hypothetical protein
MFKLIPEPKKYYYSGEEYQFGKLRMAGDSVPEYVLEMLSGFFADKAEKRLVFERLGSAGRKADSYEIEINNNGVLVKASDKGGFIYAAATLCQLAEFRDGELCLPGCSINDVPKFEIRGINWNMMAEIRSWSLDDGSGYEGFVKNIISGLDLLAKFKLNFAFLDGVGWNIDRIKGYAPLMKQLNFEARKRNVKLCYIGYSSGYEHQRDEDENTFFNRKSYPDGEKYECCGTEDLPHGKRGTCFSNAELLRLKCENLKRFVREIEPGALYLHGLDISAQKLCMDSWAHRCPECRKMFPNDDVSAVDGLAGACAHLSNSLYEAVASVTNPETGYDGSRDCMVNMVGPNYTVCSESDEDWDVHLKYFHNIFKKLKYENVFLMLREQFFHQKQGGTRFRELRQAVGPRGRLSIVYFASGSGFYDSSPVAGDAAFISLFDGIDAVITGNGNAFQETRQVMNAAYMWNPAGEYAVLLPEESNMEEFMTFYKDTAFSMNGAEAIFRQAGLLDSACEKLYGEAAGKLVSKAQRLRSKSEPACGYTAPLFNAAIPMWCFSKFKLTKWKKEIDDKALDETHKLIAVMKELIELNNTAAGLFSEAEAVAAARKEYLSRMARTCRKAASFQTILVKWAELFLNAVNGKAQVRELESIRRELKVFKDEMRKQSDRTIDKDGGDSGFAVKLTDSIIRELDAIQFTLEHPGEYSDINNWMLGRAGAGF